MLPKVSIIIPAFNVERFIAQAIDSALKQTEPNLEVIVVDDASTDDTVKILKDYTDQRLKLILLDQNAGPSHARNLALQQAQGEWIGLLDSDDWYASDRIERLLNHAYEHNLDMIGDDIHLVWEGEATPRTSLFQLCGKPFAQPQRITAVDFVNSCIPGFGALQLNRIKPMFNRIFLNKNNILWDENLWLGEDYLFYVTCLLHGANYDLLPNAYYYYRMRTGSILRQSNHLNNSIIRSTQSCQTNMRVINSALTIQNPNLINALRTRQSYLELRLARKNLLFSLRKFRLAEAVNQSVQILKNPRNLELTSFQLKRGFAWAAATLLEQFTSSSPSTTSATTHE